MRVDRGPTAFVFQRNFTATIIFALTRMYAIFWALKKTRLEQSLKHSNAPFSGANLNS
jgi:hypothetical protein